jgi:ubiquinone/menaquinone biosynthesis C-methylase UbiE
MPDKTTENIISYYDERVEKYGGVAQSTLLDENMRALEIETVHDWLDESDDVLEIFCGSGVSTLEFAGFCRSIVACDLSSKMVEHAQKNLSAQRHKFNNVTFERRDVLDIDKAYSPGQFNAIVSIRGLINLPSWDLQKQAITKVHGLLPKGGKFLILEGIKDGLVKTNDLRTKLSLPPLAEPWYDNNFDSSQLSDYMQQYFSLQNERNLDIYFLISRVIYPLACLPDAPEFSNLCNKVARLILPYAQTNTGTTLLICRYYVKK